MIEMVVFTVIGFAIGRHIFPYQKNPPTPVDHIGSKKIVLDENDTPVDVDWLETR